MTTRRQLLGQLLPLAAYGAVAPAWAQSAADIERNSGTLPAPGSRLAVPELRLLDGKLLQPSSLAGQVVVLYWWASWCPFCAVQSPQIDQLDRAQRARGLRVVGLSIDRKPEDASAYLLRKGYQFASAWVTPNVQQVLPKPKGLPVTVVLGRDGRVVMSESGQLFAEDIEGIARFL